MSVSVLAKGLVAAIMAGAIAWGLWDQQDGATPAGEKEGQRYLPVFSAVVLPLFLLVVVGLAWALYGWEAGVSMALSLCFPIFLHICLYFLALLAALPWLRRHFSARACALLWLLPNYLYITQYCVGELPGPLWVVRVPGEWLWPAVGVWGAGAALVLLWKVAGHLAFRHFLLKGAHPAEDPVVLEVWEQELKEARFPKPKFRLVVSPQAATPLSIGLFPRSARVVLPERPYTREELSLLFRHELVHIGREDSLSKFFLAFCTAVCWFNPLMWLAMRKSADDLELSCDEAVLSGGGSAVRSRYANLILSTAGDERGFTTCLSASARALRYRLKNVVAPRKKRSGALLAGAVFLVLSMTCGYVALAYGSFPGDQALFPGGGASSVALRSVSWLDDPYTRGWHCADEQALTGYLSALEVTELTGNYSFETDGPQLTLLFDQGDEGLATTLALILQEEMVKVVPFGEGKPKARWYYVPGGLDWEALSQWLWADPALNLTLQSPGGQEKALSATLWRLERLPAGGEPLIDRSRMETPSGVYVHEMAYTQAALAFSQAPVEGFTLEVESLEGDRRETLSSTDLEDPGVVPLAGYPARYRLTAQFQGPDGSLWQGEFRFEYGET